jgi:hypothetical protein
MTDAAKNRLGAIWATAIVIFGIAHWPLHSWQPASAWAQCLAIGAALVATFWIVSHGRARADG